MSVWASAMLILECTDNGNIQDNEAHLNAVQNKTEHRVFILSLDLIKIYFEDILAVEHRWKLCRGTQVSWFFCLSFFIIRYGRLVALLGQRDTVCLFPFWVIDSIKAVDT